jgi:hypothetical protein
MAPVPWSTTTTFLPSGHPGHEFEKATQIALVSAVQLHFFNRRFQLSEVYLCSIGWIDGRTLNNYFYRIDMPRVWLGA